MLLCNRFCVSKIKIYTVDANLLRFVFEKETVLNRNNPFFSPLIYFSHDKNTTPIEPRVVERQYLAVKGSNNMTYHCGNKCFPPVFNCQHKYVELL